MPESFLYFKMYCLEIVFKTVIKNTLKVQIPIYLFLLLGTFRKSQISSQLEQWNSREGDEWDHMVRVE